MSSAGVLVHRQARCEFSSVGPGPRVTITNNVLVFDRVTVGADVFLGPNVVFTNDMRPRARIKRSRGTLLATQVDDGATLGAGGVVVCGVRVGAHAFVAAAAALTRDVAAQGFFAGSPAGQHGWACTCDVRLDDTVSCATCGRRVETGPDGLRETRR